MGMEEINWDFDINDWQSVLAYDKWLALPVSSSRPSARYKHAATRVDEKLYIAGGSRNGRYLSDVQVFDLRKLTWSSLKLNLDPNADKLDDSSSKEILPATSGHSMVNWGNKLIIIGGHSKEYSEFVTVRSIDLGTHQCGVLKTSGKVPIARGGQSVTMFGSRLIVFGGEGINKRLLNDIHVLDLETMTWDVVETTQTPPSPRFDHTAAVHAERYFLIFGGCSHSTCFSDLHVLDLQTMEWSQPQIQGAVVTPRAGHAGITIDENWYIVGGGDNKNGGPETLMLSMSKLVWSVLTTVKERDPLASESFLSEFPEWHGTSIKLEHVPYRCGHFHKTRENDFVPVILKLDAFTGLSLCAALINGENHLVAFGGYNGKYNNEVYVLRPKPKGSSQPKIFRSPAAAAAAASVTAAYALTAKTEKKLDFSKSEDSSLKEVQTESSQQNFTVEIDAFKTERKMLQSTLSEVRAENSRIKENIDETNNTYAELSKELHSVQGQLVDERSRCFKLEAQIAELQKMLESLQSIEYEVQVLRNQKSSLEQDVELSAAGAPQRQSSGGVWQWIAGGTSST